MSKLAASAVAIAMLLSTACLTTTAGPSGGPTGGACNGADLSSDSENCGVCGTSCGGGACSAGVCQEAVLATDQEMPTGVTVSGDTVFWTNRGPKRKDGTRDGQIVSCPILGCPASGPTLVRGGLGSPLQPRLEGDQVYFLSGRANIYDSAFGFAPMRTPLGLNGAAEQLAYPTSGDAVALTVSQGKIFFAMGESVRGKGDAYIAGCPAAGCAQNGTTYLSLAKDLKGVSTLIADDTFVYYAEVGPGVIARASRTTGKPSSLFTAEIAVASLAQDEDHLYWGTSLPAINGVTVKNYLARGPKTGGAKEKLAEVGELASLTVDGDYVYWAEVTGKVARMKKTGGPTEALAEVQLQPHSLTVAGDFLYWVTEMDGKVHRIRK